MDDQQQEFDNEQVYQEGYLPKPKEVEVLGDCPECLDVVRSDQDYAVDILYKVFNSSNSGESNHTEWYHIDCCKKMEKRKHGKQ